MTNPQDFATKGYDEGYKAYMEGYKDALERAQEVVRKTVDAQFCVGQYEHNQAVIDCAWVIRNALELIKEEL